MGMRHRAYLETPGIFLNRSRASRRQSVLEGASAGGALVGAGGVDGAGSVTVAAGSVGVPWLAGEGANGRETVRASKNPPEPKFGKGVSAGWGFNGWIRGGGVPNSMFVAVSS
jgi:hypothetical protein